MADPTPTYQRHHSHDGAALLLEYPTTPTGDEVTLWICEECHFIEAICEHSKCQWNKEGTELTCQLCGLDGT